MSKDYPERIDLKIRDGIVIVAGDAHYLPGYPPVMHRALLYFIKKEKPRAFVFNGDVIDAPTISKHPRRGWETRPLLNEEIENAKVRMGELEERLNGAYRTWNRGNHDDRFESFLSKNAPEFGRLHGFHLDDHFPNWRITTTTWINDSVVIKHRYKGGRNAPLTNTMQAGKTIITGHLHSSAVAPYSDYSGTRYGVDHGCIADTDSPLFNYCEGNPLNWRSAFCILTFVDGMLLLPELVLKVDTKTVQYRGKLISV